MEDIRPTAKWAKRMLRPLASIYHRLEKHQEIIAHSKWKERTEGADNAHAKPAKLVPAGESCQYSDEEPDDPAWVPGKPDKRRIRHNYSSRGQRNGGRRRSRLLIRSPEMRRTLPGAIEIATPLITGKIRPTWEASSIRKQLFRVELPATAAGPSGLRKPARTNKTAFPAYQGSWKEVLDLSGDAGLVDIAHLLDRIFLKFLRHTRATTASQQQHGRGARSLVSMIARRLPEFIADEQRIQDEVDEDCDVDMCDAYFTELEAYYAPSGYGWEPLREAVRAQGLYLVAQMIEKGWVTKLVACRLMEECMRHDESDAFELMISRYLPNMDTYNYPAAFDPQRPSTHCDDPVYILRTFYSRSIGGRRAFVYDELAKLLLRGVIPAEWMVTTWWKDCVDGAIKSVSTEDIDSAAAMRLVEAVVLSAGGVYLSKRATVSHRSGLHQRQPLRARGTRASAATSIPAIDQTPCPIPLQDALSNLVSSLVTALCGMYMARSAAADASGKLLGLKVRNTIGCLALAVEREIGLRHRQDNSDVSSCQSLRRGYVLLGNCMLQIGEAMPTDMGTGSGTVSKQRLESFFVSLALQQDMLKELADLVQRVCRYCGYTSVREQTRTPLEVRTKVSQLAGQADVRGLPFFLGKVAAETAMALAEKTLDPDDHVWAAQIQESVISAQQRHNARPGLSHGSERREDRTGLFRWEESIGEWVARTPKPRAGNMYMASGDGFDEARQPSPDSDLISTKSTSSAPSLPAKRTSGNRLAYRPVKRLRSRTVEIYTDEAKDQDCNTEGQRSYPSPPLCPSPETRVVPVAARTRSARAVLKELVQGRNVPNRTVVRGSKLGFSAPQFEVVIINKKNPILVDEDEPQPAEEDSDCDLEVCDPSPREPRLPTISKVLNLRQRSFPCTRSVSRMRMVIPCSQDDESEDELSFL